jgi:hypothetical protein
MSTNKSARNAAQRRASNGAAETEAEAETVGMTMTPSAPNAVLFDFYKVLAQSSIRSTQQFLRGWEEMRSTQLATVRKLETDLQQAIEYASQAATVDDLAQLPARMATLTMQRLTEQANRMMSLVVETETALASHAQNDLMELTKRLPQSLPITAWSEARPIDADWMHNVSSMMEAAQNAYSQVTTMWTDAAARQQKAMQ